MRRTPQNHNFKKVDIIMCRRFMLLQKTSNLEYNGAVDKKYSTIKKTDCGGCAALLSQHQVLLDH
jgi:hypothetical protein